MLCDDLPGRQDALPPRPAALRCQDALPPRLAAPRGQGTEEGRPERSRPLPTLGAARRGAGRGGARVSAQIARES